MPKIKRMVSVSEMICDALLSLIEQGRPYAEISIQEIVDKAGVCRNSFYRNFSSRDDIFQKRFLEICRETELTDAIPQDFDYFDVFRVVCQKFYRHRRFFRCYYAADARSYFDTVTRQLIRSNTSQPAASVPAEDYYTYACRAWTGLGVITEWFLRDCDIPIEELVQIVRTHRL